ncbi:MAG: hypothetical protein ACI89X_004913, partial [Planctomycetota bacterium]
EHRQTVTDKSKFWVGRPNVSGALLSGFTVTDLSALLTPYVSYYGPPGKGVLVQDGYRTAAELSRPVFEISAVPGKAVQQENTGKPAVPDDVVLVRITYAAVERDILSADDHILRHGSGVLFLDRSGRSVVVTARSLVDASFTEGDAWGDPEIDGEVTKVHLANGTVMRAHRVWVDSSGQDLAALVLEDAPPDLLGTPSDRLVFKGTIEGVPLQIRAVGPNGAELPVQPMASDLALSEVNLGGCVAADDKVIGIFGREVGDVVSAIVSLEHLPADLRPQ